MKRLGIISVGFDVTDQLLIRFLHSSNTGENIYLSIGQSTQQLFTIKQNKHYCAKIFYVCVVIPLHVSTLLLGHPQACSIQALVTKLL
jgi:hypothetical protein